MNKIMMLIFGVVALFLLAGNAWCANDLQYDGVYMSNEHKSGNISYRTYIRFYQDGDVIRISSTGSPTDLRKWFSKENQNQWLFRGKISTIEGNRISFSVRDNKGSIDYSGQIEGDTINLSSYSHMNKNQSNDIYSFVKW